MGTGGQRALSTDETAELVALLQLRLLPGVGDRGIHRLLAACGTAREAVAAPDGVLREKAGGAAMLGRRAEAGEARRKAGEILQRARDLGMTVVGRGLPGYPGPLLDLADPPPVLFLKGRMELLGGERVAVVGTRRATGAGRRFATGLGRALSAHSVPLVSGLALGIDGAAHRGALEGPGSTVAVLGTGLDRVHPRSHRRLQERIAREGLLVSEFVPGEWASRHHFPRRNRILAALARAVVVVEAGARSGALITVDHALDLGREIFAVPGSVESDQAKGTNALLRDGAGALSRPDDFIEHWPRILAAAREPVPAGGTAREPTSVRATERAPGSVRGVAVAGPSTPRPGARSPADAVPQPARAERAIADPLGVLDVLGPRPVSVERLSRRLHLPPERLLQALCELELLGGAVRDLEGWRSARPEDDPQVKRREIRKKGR